MCIETEFPSMTHASAVQTAADVDFYLSGYESAANWSVAARGRKEYLGKRPSFCRFCSRTAPVVSFRKEAHAIPELAGNGMLLSYYECDECNQRFSSFEDDLGKLTLLDRIAGQVFGKNGVPSAKSTQKRSRIDMDLNEFKIQQHEEDPVAETDHEAKTLTITVAPQRYRPLGVYKALVKVALSLMQEQDLAKVPHALRWLLAADLTTDRIDDGLHYTCIRTFTPGPAPFALTRAALFRRKRRDVVGPAYIFVLAFGNISFQIAVPAPQEDQHLIGQTICIRTVPLFAFMDQSRVAGPTRYWKQDLSSYIAIHGPGSATFKFDDFQIIAGQENHSTS